MPLEAPEMSTVLPSRRLAAAAEAIVLAMAERERAMSPGMKAEGRVMSVVRVRRLRREGEAGIDTESEEEEEVEEL
jgi:hypothetical protein